MKYYIKQKIFSLKDKFYVRDFEQNDLYMVKGKMFSISNKLDLLDLDEEVLFSAQKKIITFLPKYTIFSKNGEELAVVKRLFGFRPKFSVTLGHQELEVQGTFFAHDFTVTKDNQEVASITKKLFAFGDSYEIDIHDEANQLLYMFIVIIIDQIIHESKKRNNA